MREQGRRNGSESKWLSLSSVYMWNKVVQLRDCWVSGADDIRSVSLFCFSPGELLHSARCKINPPQIHRNFSQSHHHVHGLHLGEPMFRMNVQMSSITQNRPKTTWQKQHNRKRKNFLQSAKKKQKTSSSTIHCKKLLQLCFSNWQDWADINQFMCHKTTGSVVKGVMSWNVIARKIVIAHTPTVIQ